MVLYRRKHSQDTELTKLRSVLSVVCRSFFSSILSIVAIKSEKSPHSSTFPLLDVADNFIVKSYMTYLPPRRCARSFVILLPLLGVTWAFGLMRLAGLGVEFDYVFTVLNSIQVSTQS